MIQMLNNISIRGKTSLSIQLNLLTQFINARNMLTINTKGQNHIHMCV